MKWLIWLLWAGVALAQPIRPSEESLRARERFQQAVQEGRYRIVTGDARCQRIDSIGQRLAGLARRPIPWTFTLVDTDEPNAACCGEGVVFVTTGLLKLNLDDDELAGVLAHEVIHGVRQHVDADYIEIAKLEKALEEYELHRQRHGNETGETAEMREAYEFNRLNQQLQQASSYMRQKTPFSHAQESEADSMGLRLAVSAGFKPQGLMSALQKLMARQVAQYGQRSLLGSKTHPPLPKRIERLVQIQTQLGY
ncbi:MAG: M48 family metallopeptidase [Vulcanimicrobiota bacterium]